MLFHIRNWRYAGLILLSHVLLTTQAWPTPPGRTIGGTITGLVPGSRITLTYNGKDSITVAANGKFTFPGTLAESETYNVTIQSQPDNLRCIVQNGSGTVRGASITNLVVTCPMAYRNSLTWMRCTHGQAWNVSRGDCTGTGKANSFGAERMRYCPRNDTSCNGGSNTGSLNEASAIFTACDKLNEGEGTFGIKTWRVPAKDELRQLVVCSDGTPVPLNDYGTDPYKCGYKKPNYVNGSYTAPAIDIRLFPNTMSLEYWSATPAEKQASSAWNTAFQNGWTATAAKSGQAYLRCVSGP